MNSDYTGVIGIIYFGDYEKFALVKSLRTGNVSFPGGGREDGENDPKVTLKRELNEIAGLKEGDYEVSETGITHDFVFNSRKKGRYGQRGKSIVYLVKVNTMDLRPQDGITKTFGWFDKADVAKKLTFLDFANIFKQVMMYVY